ncbi:MAG: tagatose 1,6-diphosphate aldolase [Chloroflexi bacterium]|jgi:tagatose 1,6-diphosphate aldolase|nr:MAG: tagatose 1,6-diphosphate aldolase [Chloroflexota bacterium]
MALSAGKLINLKQLSDASGRFLMLAIDQRGSMEQALQKVLGDGRKQTPEDVVAAKVAITGVLAPHSTATLMDPIYGFPYTLEALPPKVGVLLAVEHSGYEAGPSGKGRKAMILDGWSVSKVKRSGSNAVKLLIHYHPDAPEEVLKHQHDVVRQVGEACVEEDIPFLLETVGYAVDEPSTDGPEYALAKPRITIASATEFSKPEYRVDVLKLEFPTSLKFTEEFCNAYFDSKTREPVYGVKEVKDICKQLDAASSKPWVILSGGVDIDEFLFNLQFSVDAGASGFLCGRAMWQQSLQFYPDTDAMVRFLETDGVYNFNRIKAIASNATPWNSRGDGGAPSLDQKSLEWHKEYRGS